MVLPFMAGSNKIMRNDEFGVPLAEYQVGVV
jgi:hypothetical protein